MPIAVQSLLATSAGALAVGAFKQTLAGLIAGAIAGWAAHMVAGFAANLQNWSDDN